MLIRPDGVHAIEQFVMAKYYLTTMVYRHKVRLITDLISTDPIRMQSVRLLSNSRRVTF